MTPTDCLVEAMGGVRPASRLLKRHGLDLCPSAISRWRSRSDGVIPSRYLPFLIDVARREKLPLTLDELVYGRDSETAVEPVSATA